METSTGVAPRRRRRWRMMSVRAMLLLVLMIGLPMGWWTRTAQLQRAAVRRIDAMDAAVVYDFEVLDEGRVISQAEYRVFLAKLGAGATVHAPGPPTPNNRPEERWKVWTRANLGVDYSDSVTQLIAEHSSKIHDSDLAILDNFPNLELLNLGETTIGDAGLEHLVGLRKLKVLHLDSTRVTDAGLARLEGLAGLEILSLGDNGEAITDIGLARLKALKGLKVLEIGGPKITDAGLGDLRALPNLKKLFLIEAPNVTEEGIAALRSTLPKVEIVQYTALRSTRRRHGVAVPSPFR